MLEPSFFEWDPMRRVKRTRIEAASERGSRSEERKEASLGVGPDAMNIGLSQFKVV